MPTYALHLETDRITPMVTLRLLDEHGSLRGSHEVVLRDHADSKWEALFDTRHYVERYQHALRNEHGRLATADDILGELGVFIGQSILGPEILGELTRTIQHRTLVVRLPSTEDDVLAAAFARVPWELARPAHGQPPLMERNLAVRAITETTEAGDSAVHRVAEHLAATKGVVRVLAVFAASPGSRPLAMRLARERLRQLFEQEILPHRNVELDVLCHGVTREVLRERITARGGYHIVHWVGHGHHDRLELLGADDGPASLSGQGFVDLLRDAGGFVPQLVFLSACLSGLLVGSEARPELRRALHGPDLDRARVVPPQRSLGEVLDPGNAPGYTGTAMALLRAGVPQVVAMRYEVGDDYARELAWGFYKRLLADPGKPPTETALALARDDVRQRGSSAARRMPVDHANPLLFGQPGRRLEPGERRSKQMQRLRPRPQPLLPNGGGQLDRPERFAGREQALTRINRALQQGGHAVTVLHGLRGLGKTALAAEALHLWHDRFDWVLAFHVAPGRLSIEDFLRQVDQRLSTASTAYRERCEAAALDRVWLESSEPLRGQLRYDRMRTNLVEAMRDEAVLLVIDAFERNLESMPSEGGYACADPQWDAVLKTLCEQLPTTRSRVIVTTLHRPKALAEEGTLWLAVGPLSWAETVLYARSHEGVSRLLEDRAGHELLDRMFAVAEGHPLVWDRLAALSSDRRALTTVLDLVERDGLAALPGLAGLLTSKHADVERTYLEDMVERSVDALLERTSATARRLLWVLSLASEPVAPAILAGVWSGLSVEDELTEEIRAEVAMRDQLSPARRERLDARSPMLLERLAMPAAVPVESAPIEPLIAELLEAGLVNEEEYPSAVGAATKVTEVWCHALVRERVMAWMDVHPADRSARTAEQIWRSYGLRYAMLFEGEHRSRAPRSRSTDAYGRRALVYLLRARDFESLSRFGGILILSTSDPRVLDAIVAELRVVAQQLPAGEHRWLLQVYMADAMRSMGRSDEALPLYERVAAETERAEAWGMSSWCCCNWANALRDVGRLHDAQVLFVRSAHASRKAGRPPVDVVATELEALRVAAQQGHAEKALPEIEARVEEIRGWWNAHRDGRDVPEAPDALALGKAMMSSLDVAEEAHAVLERWQECLVLNDERERVGQALGETEHDRAHTRMSRLGPLHGLGRLEEAQTVLEACVDELRRSGNAASESRALADLADLWAQRGDLRLAMDLQRQALAIVNRLPDPNGRAIAHNNLAAFLEESSQFAAAAAHRLAAMAYAIVSGHAEHGPHWMRNLARAKQESTGSRYELPRLVDILALAAFEPLRGFLDAGEVDRERLQVFIDDIEARVDRAIRA